MKTLKIADGLALPLSIAGQCVAVFGIRGSGKTNTAGALAEELLAQHQPIAVIDPTDAWWGLRAGRDGNPAGGFPVFIFGGAHQDVPLNETDGKVIAEFVVREQVPVVLSLRHLRKAAQRRFVTEFCEELYHLKGKPEHRSPLTVFIDEAPLFVPQRVLGEVARTVGAVEDLIARGRVSGFGVVLISQRSATLNADVRTQADTVISHRLTAPLDRKAISDWFEENASVERLKEILQSLATLKNGEAWVWAPQLDIMTRTQVRLRRTFDSSATPKIGETIRPPKKLTEIDVEKLKGDLAATIEKAKADDPRELKKRIAELERHAKGATQPNPKTEPIRQPLALTDADRALLTTLREELQVFSEHIGAKADAMLMRLADRVKAVVEETVTAWTAEADKRRALYVERFAGTRVQRILDKLDQVAPVAVSIHPSTVRPATREALVRVARSMAAPVATRPAAARPTVNGSGTAPLAVGERTVLTAIAQYADGITRDQLGVLTGYKRSSRDTYIQRLAAQGYVEVAAGQLLATQAGVAALGPDFTPLPTGDELLAWWRSRLPEGERRVLDAIVAAHPRPLSRDAIDDATGYKRSSRDTYLQRLASRRLVVTAGRGEVRASDDLFSLGR